MWKVLAALLVALGLRKRPSSTTTEPMEPTPQDPHPTPWDAEFFHQGRLRGVDPRLLKAIALWEHRGEIRPTAVGDDGNSIGVFQINRFWWAGSPSWLEARLGYTKADLFDPAKNIAAGALIAQRMILELGVHADLDSFIQAWSLGTPKVLAGVTNAPYLHGVRGYLTDLDPAGTVEV